MPGQLVVDDHEDHDGQDGHQPGDEALADRVGAEGRADRPFFEVADPGRKRAGLEDDDQVVGLFDREAALDDAAVADAGVDVGGRLDLVVEDDGQVLADVGPGDLLEAARRRRRSAGRRRPGCSIRPGPRRTTRRSLPVTVATFSDEVEAAVAPLGIAPDDLGVLGD